MIVLYRLVRDMNFSKSIIKRIPHGENDPMQDCRHRTLLYSSCCLWNVTKSFTSWDGLLLFLLFYPWTIKLFSRCHLENFIFFVYFSTAQSCHLLSSYVNENKLCTLYFCLISPKYIFQNADIEDVSKN